jgi:hypothetical protein
VLHAVHGSAQERDAKGRIATPDPNETGKIAGGTTVAHSMSMTYRHARERRLLILTALGLWLALGLLAGCVPIRGRMPTATFHPSERGGAPCDDPAELRGDPSRWPAAERNALRAGLQHDEPVIVSALGCHVDVLPQCRVEGSYRLSALQDGVRLDLQRAPVSRADLDGDCEAATHVVSAAEIVDDELTATELGRLGLDGYRVTGSWRGVMRQPNGPYEVYDMVLDLEQLSDRVRGFSYLSSIDGEYWGRFRFEGKLEGNTLYFADVEILEDNLGIFLAWCMKGGFLLVDPATETMKGPWTAGMCLPGTVELVAEGTAR